MSTLSFKNVDINNISLMSPDKLDNHYICNMKYNDNLLYVQTPSLIIENITEEFVILKLNDEFKKFIENIDNHCIKITYDNSENWFKKEIPYDALMNMYENIDIDDNTIRIDFPYIRDKLQCKIYNSDREDINITELREGNSIVVLLYFKGLKIFSSNFHLDFHINQIKLVENQYKILKEYSIIDDEENEVSNGMDDYIFKEDIDIELKKQEQEKLEIKKNKELEIKNKMKELEEQLNKLNN